MRSVPALGQFLADEPGEHIVAPPGANGATTLTDLLG